jgi:hypothetical protein
MAEAPRADIAARMDWVKSDLANWSGQPVHYDLVTCLNVRVAWS